MEVDPKNKKPEIRYLYDMREVLYDKEWAKTAPNLELYYMYRGIKEEKGLRYDITIIPAKMLGKEYNKTKGHEHIGNYGEIYIVLSGKAIYLMQKRKGKEILDTYAVKAEKGNVIIIPPNYGHLTINPCSKKLKMANWMASSVKSDYKTIEKLKGACYFYTKTGWIKNKNYRKVPELRFEKPLKSLSPAQVVKLANTLASGANALKAWEFESPPGHQ